MPFRKSIAQASLEALSLLARRVNREIPRLCECKFEQRFVRKTKRKSTPKRSKIEPKSVQNRSPERPRSHRGPEFRPRAQESAPRGAPSGPKDALGGPQGRPKSDQGRPKSAQRGPEGSPEGPRERQNRPQVGLRSEKSQICEKCSATRPCRRSRHFAPPRSTPNRPKIVPSRSLEPLERPPRSTLVARRCLKRPRRATSVDSGRLGRPQGSPVVRAHSLTPCPPPSPLSPIRIGIYI